MHVYLSLSLYIYIYIYICRSTDLSIYPSFYLKQTHGAGGCAAPASPRTLPRNCMYLRTVSFLFCVAWPPGLAHPIREVEAVNSGDGREPMLTLSCRLL